MTKAIIWLLTAGLCFAQGSMIPLMIDTNTRAVVPELGSTNNISFTNPVTVLEPVATNNPATKKYVDDLAATKTGFDFGLWGVTSAGHLTLLDPSVRLFAGIWELDSSFSVVPSTNTWYDLFWTTNGVGDYVPREIP